MTAYSRQSKMNTTKLETEIPAITAFALIAISSNSCYSTPKNESPMISGRIDFKAHRKNDSIIEIEIENKTTSEFNFLDLSITSIRGDSSRIVRKHGAFSCDEEKTLIKEAPRRIPPGEYLVIKWDGKDSQCNVVDATELKLEMRGSGFLSGNVTRNRNKSSDGETGYIQSEIIRVDSK